jgi:hypothetical protein
MAETTNMASDKDYAGQTRQNHEVLCNVLLWANHSKHCEPSLYVSQQDRDEIIKSLEESAGQITTLGNTPWGSLFQLQ